MVVSFLFRCFLNTLSFALGLLGHGGISLFSKILSFLFFDLLQIRRRIILKNLDIAYGHSKTPKEKRCIGRASVASFLCTIFELLAAKKLFPQNTHTFKQIEIMQKALQEKQGVYAMCIHMGNWEYLCHAASQKLATVHVVVKPVGNGTLTTWIENMRKAIGFSLIDRKALLSPTTQIFNALDKGDIIGFVVDQKRPKGEFLPFFNKMASTNNSLAKLWLKKNAPIIPVFIQKKGTRTHEITFLPPLHMKHEEHLSMAENITENTKRMNLIVEQMIKTNPEEYFWMHNRWE
jgi:KDO2-lipid IV(A) lauroyltransferase